MIPHVVGFIKVRYMISTSILDHMFDWGTQRSWMSWCASGDLPRLTRCPLESPHRRVPKGHGDHLLGCSLGVHS